MKVAIMGAGLAGLSCAITLEKNGINPFIFEKRTQVGDRFVNGEVMLSLLNRPVTDVIAYFSEKHGIFLSPVANIKQMLLYSQHKQADIKGVLGFSTLRGRDSDSLENQLARQVKNEIFFNSKASYEELLEDYTHVILATGDATYASRIQNFREDLTVTLHGAMVEGYFDRYSVGVWLDNRFAPQGYGYLIPTSDKEANLVIAYPDYPENRDTNINEMWSSFFKKVCKDVDQDLKITDKFEVTRYIIGICEKARIGNTFFVGNCFGSIMPFMGFGQYISLLTGVLAAKDICGQGSYIELTKGIRKSYHNSVALRRVYERFNNSQQDWLVQKLNSHISSKVFNTKVIDPLKYLSYLARPWALTMRSKV